ncbi:L,D-transpeptidase family protein [Hymenobacter coalescens]
MTGQGETTVLAGQVQRFYASVGFAPVWTDTAGPLPAATAGRKLLLLAREYGLNPVSFSAAADGALLDSLRPVGSARAQLRRRAAAETQLTEALLQFVSQLRRGPLLPESLLPATCAPDSLFDPVTWLHTARRSKDFTRELLAAQPRSRSYVRLVWAWQRLCRTDTAAARRVGWQVAANLQRLRWEPAADTAYLVVNIPAYSLQVVRGSAVVRTFRVVVGGPATPTPELSSRVRFFQTSPEWKVPRSIATREMLPQLRRNPGYMDANNYVLYDRQGQVVNPRRVDWKQVTAESFPYTIRQAAYGDNALGNVVFRFPNAHDIFVHDTPSRKFFNKPVRALSHGCIRLEKPLQLAVFLLRRDYADKPEKGQRLVERMWDSVYGGYSKYFPLRYPIPIHIRYLTCHADDGPALRHLADVYGRDAALIQALQTTHRELPSADAR